MNRVEVLSFRDETSGIANAISKTIIVASAWYTYIPQNISQERDQNNSIIFNSNDGHSNIINVYIYFSILEIRCTSNVFTPSSEKR